MGLELLYQRLPSVRLLIEDHWRLPRDPLHESGHFVLRRTVVAVDQENRLRTRNYPTCRLRLLPLGHQFDLVDGCVYKRSSARDLFREVLPVTLSLARRTAPDAHVIPEISESLKRCGPIAESLTHHHDHLGLPGVVSCTLTLYLRSRCSLLQRRQLGQGPIQFHSSDDNRNRSRIAQWAVQVAFVQIYLRWPLERTPSGLR